MFLLAFCHKGGVICTSGASMVAQTVKNLPAMRESCAQSLGREDTLEEGIATHSSILAYRIPWTEDPGRLQSQVSLVVQLVKNSLALQDPGSIFGRKIHWRRDRLPTPVFLGFPGGSADKESTCNEGDLGSIPGLGGSPGERKGYSLQYSGLE